MMSKSNSGWPHFIRDEIICVTVSVLPVLQIFSNVFYIKYQLILINKGFIRSVVTGLIIYIVAQMLNFKI